MNHWIIFITFFLHWIGSFPSYIAISEAGPDLDIKASEALSWLHALNLRTKILYAALTDETS